MIHTPTVGVVEFFNPDLVLLPVFSLQIVYMVEFKKPKEGEADALSLIAR